MFELFSKCRRFPTTVRLSNGLTVVGNSKNVQTDFTDFCLVTKPQNRVLCSYILAVYHRFRNAAVANRFATSHIFLDSFLAAPVQFPVLHTRGSNSTQMYARYVAVASRLNWFIERNCVICRRDLASTFVVENLMTLHGYTDLFGDKMKNIILNSGR